MSVGHTASRQFKGCQRLLSPHNGLSGGSNRRFLFSGSHYLISQTSCVQRGARLGRIAQNKGRHLRGGAGIKGRAKYFQSALSHPEAGLLISHHRDETRRQVIEVFFLSGAERMEFKVNLWQMTDEWGRLFCFCFVAVVFLGSATNWICRWWSAAADLSWWWLMD